MWKWASDHKDQLAAVGAAAGVIGMLFAGLSYANDVTSGGPEESAPPSRSPSPVIEPSRTPQGYVRARAGDLYLELRSTAVPPQSNFDPHTWSSTENDDHGVTFECRLAADRKSGCADGADPVYFLDPVEPGATVAPAKADPATRSCTATVSYSHAIAIQENRSYCVTGSDWILVIRTVDLPDRIVGGDTVVLGLHAEFWKR